VIVIEAVPFAPDVNVRPVVPERASVPCPTLKVTDRLEEPASTSLMEIRFPEALLKTRFVSSFVV
jgi:hypothetical protein